MSLHDRKPGDRLDIRGHLDPKGPYEYRRACDIQPGDVLAHLPEHRTVVSRDWYEVTALGGIETRGWLITCDDGLQCVYGPMSLVTVLRPLA